MSNVIGRTLAVTLAAAVFVSPWTAGDARASGFQLIEQNASGLGNAYAGQAAAANDASMIYFNPAGLTLLPGRQIVVAGNLVRPRAEFTNSGSTAATLQTRLGGNGGDAGDLALVPNLYLSWQLAPQAWVGLGVNAPFGLKTEWDADWVGRFHAVKSEVRTININPSVAWKVNEMFSVGAGINVMRLDAEISRSVNYSAAGGVAALPLFAATCPGASAAGGCEGLSTIKADDWGWGWNAGATFQFNPMTRLGIAYRSTIKQKLEGDVRFENRPAALATALPNGNIKADVKLPDTLSIALAHQLNDRVQLLADYTWTGWDSIQDLSIYRDTGAGLSSLPLRFKNSWRAGVGVNYQLDERWKLRGGVAFDRTPVKDEFRTPRLPDQDRRWLAVGAQFKISKQAILDFGYAHLFIKDASSNLPNIDPAPPAGFTALPQGALRGAYDASVNILSVQLRYDF